MLLSIMVDAAALPVNLDVPAAFAENICEEAGHLVAHGGEADEVGLEA